MALMLHKIKVIFKCFDSSNNVFYDKFDFAADSLIEY